MDKSRIYITHQVEAAEAAEKKTLRSERMAVTITAAAEQSITYGRNRDKECGDEEEEEETEREATVDIA